jgi:hypothetical protein
MLPRLTFNLSFFFSHSSFSSFGGACLLEPDKRLHCPFYITWVIVGLVEEVLSSMVSESEGLEFEFEPRPHIISAAHNSHI